MFLTIEGCIASGKTTTARLVGRTVGYPILTEETEAHPFLTDFYEDPSRYALETELAFVLLHYHRLQTLGRDPSVVSDFSIAKDLIFARMNLQGHDLKLFEHLYTDLAARVRKPDLAVFLDLPIDELMRRIRKRGRPYELDIPVGYVERLRQFYEHDMQELGEEVRVLELGADASREDVADSVLRVVREVTGNTNDSTRE